MNKTALMKAIKSEKNVKTYQKLIAINMVRDKGCSTSLAAESVGTTQCSVQLWLERFDEYGVDGLRNLPQDGGPPLVSYERILKFANRLFKKGVHKVAKPNRTGHFRRKKAWIYNCSPGRVHFYMRLQDGEKIPVSTWPKNPRQKHRISHKNDCVRRTGR